MPFRKLQTQPTSGFRVLVPAKPEKEMPEDEAGFFSKVLSGIGAVTETVAKAEMGLIKKGLNFVGVGKAIDYFADTPFMREAAEGLEVQAQQEGRGVVFGKADLIPINILRGATENPASAIPYFGELYDISQIVKLRSISEKTRAGTATPDEAKWVKDYLDNHNETVRRHKEEWGYSVGSVLQQSVQFMGEILGASLLAPVTGGGSIAGLVAEKGALKAAKEVALKITTNAAARKIFTREIGQYALGAGIRAGIASSTRIPLGTVQRMTGSPITNDNGDFTGLAEDGQPLSEAMINSVSSALVEYSSEFTGGAFTALGVGAKTALIKAGFLKAIIKANPSVTPSLIARVIQKVGWHGTLEEWGEERVADIMFAALHEVGLSDQTFDISVKQVVDELASFALMGTIMRGAKKALGGGEKKEPTKEGDITPPEPPEPPDDGGGVAAAVADVTTQLQEGKSPAEIAIELTNDMSATAARAVVAEAVLNEAQAPTEQKPSEITQGAQITPKATFEEAIGKLKAKVEGTITAKEEADAHEEAQAKLTTQLAEINQNIEELTKQVASETKGTPAQKALKKKIGFEEAKARTAERNFQTAVKNREEATRAFFQEEVKKEEISEKDQATVVQAVMVRIGTPAFVQRSGGLSLREVLNQAVAAVKTIREAKKPSEKSAKEEKVAKKAKEEVAEKSEQEKKPMVDMIEEAKKTTAQKKKEAKQKAKKEEFEIGDVITGSGYDRIIESIGKRSVKFQGFQPFDKTTLRKLLKEGDWMLKRGGIDETSEPKEAVAQVTDKGQVQEVILSEIKTARDAAKDLIRSAVLGGETLKQLSLGQQGAHGEVYHAQIGGYVNGKNIGTNKIQVSNLNDEELSPIQVFSLKEIFDEILKEKPLPKKEEGAIIKDDEQDTDNRGGETGQGELPEPFEVGGKKPGVAGGNIKKRGGGEGSSSRERSRRVGVRLGARLTQEQVKEAVESVTSVENDEVQITGEITDSILEVANQYAPGGETKEGRGILDEYYTNSQIVDIVKSLFDFGGDIKVLEPAVGTGNFLWALPDTGKQNTTAFEINPLTARIAKIFHQDAQVFNTSFETLFIDERGKKKEFAPDYDLVLGNPPYGEHRGKYLGLGEEPNIKKYEEYFVKRGLDLLKEGGHLAMVLPSGFLDSENDKVKERISEIGWLKSAWRLPQGVFEGTEIGTDIVIFEKSTTKQDGKIIDRSNDISNGKFFKDSPSNILGQVKQKKDRFGRMVNVVEGTLEDAIAAFAEQRHESEAIRLVKEIGLPQTQENIEDAEAAIEETGNEEAAKKEVAKKKGKKIITEKIIKKAPKITETASLSSQFEGEFSEQELNYWKATLPDGSLGIAASDIDKTVANKWNGRWYNNFNYLKGDIYQKLFDLDVEKDIDKDQRNRQRAKLEAVLPRVETTDDIKLSPNTQFVANLEIGGDNEYVGDIEDLEKKKTNTLRSAFLAWLEDLPRAAFGDSSNWEVREYVNNESVRGSDKAMNEKIRVRRKRIAEDLFVKFLKDLPPDQNEDVKDAYNRTFNFHHTPDYRKVPMFSEISTNFKNGLFALYQEQKYGIGRLVTEGIGLLAHGVGVGKTISAVLAVNELLHRGWINKPLIVVPSDAMARQWIEGHIQQLVPNAKVNYLGNLGGEYKGDLSTLKIEDGSFTVITYEGLKRLSFKDATYNRLSTEFGYITDDLEMHKTKRGKEKDDARDESTAGRMKKGTREDIFFEDLGFDHITFDEVQNANHIVSKVKMDKGQASEYARFNLQPSDLGIKTWVAAQYIQQNNNGRNVFLLSATPFTNHPLEYYSVLSLIADKYLQKMGFRNVNEFFGQFMEASNEYEFKADGTYQRKTDIRGFKNYRQFRKLLDGFIDFREGDVIRPNRVSRVYEIPQNEFYAEMEVKAQAIFHEDEKEKGKGARTLRAINELRAIAFSPYASQFAPTLGKDQYKEFVENSPKIKTLVELIRRNKKDRPDGGNLVYFDEVGRDFLPFIKTYLIKDVGFKPEEVEIMTGETAKKKRPDLQDKYNSGEIKVLLASVVIKEGLELQRNSTDLYIVSLPWNFTRLTQVIGRAWRQGNDWKNVRINNLYMQDGIDIFLAQKLDNKQKRYEAAIKSDEQEVDVGDVTYEDLKFDLMRDPVKRAKLELQAQQEKLKMQITEAEAELAYATRKFEKLSEIADSIADKLESIASEEKLQLAAKAKGEGFDTWWMDKLNKEIKQLRKDEKEELDKLAEKGIDIKELKLRQERETAVIEELKKKRDALDEQFDERVKELAASLPVRQQFSKAVLDEFVNERTEHNKTFYEKIDRTRQTLSVKEEVKEIKNAAGTKVVKRVKKQQLVKKETKADTIEDVLSDPNMSVEEKVDALLKTKQASKEFKDAGERVAGSRKEKAVIKKIMESGDKELMGEFINKLGAEAISLLYDKHDILEDAKKPDPAADKEAGVPSYIAYIKKDILDKIPRKFELDRRGRRRYSNNSTVTVRYADKEDKDWIHKDSITTKPEDAKYLQKVLAEYPTILKEFVEKLAEVKDFKGLSDFWEWFEVNYSNESEESVPLRKKIVMKDGKEIFFEDVLFGTQVSNYEMRVAGYWSSRNPSRAYERYQEDLVKKGKNKSDREQIAKDIKEWDEILNRQSWWDKIFNKKKAEREDTELRHGNFAPLDHIERSAEPIPDKKIQAETFMRDYGFKSVQLGNYMDDPTTKEHYRHALGAIEDMTELLKIDFPAIINKTGLSIAFGARGGGGFAVAHYEPHQNIINITKKRGDGSFGHEFMHFLDFKTAGFKGYTNRWSSKKDRWYRGDTLAQAVVALNNEITGEKGRKVKEFVPSDDPDISEDHPVLKWRKEGKSFEEVLKMVDEAQADEREIVTIGEYRNWDKRRLYDTIADVYRKPVKREVDFWREDTNYYKNSKNYGGKYWINPEELLARAFQSYLEDKMAEAGMKNNYLTRSTLSDDEKSSLYKVYPQGDERKRINARFEAVFAELRQYQPVTAQTATEARFRAKTGVSYALTNAGDFLRDLKDRLNLDFDVHFVDSILAHQTNPFTKEHLRNLEALGVTMDNTIALTKELADSTAPHEVVHITLANIEKIPIFRREGMTKEKILRAYAEQAGIEYGADTLLEIEEEVSENFSRYLNNKYAPRGIIAKFFRLLKTLLTKFARAVLHTKGDIVQDYYDILAEGVETEEEMMRLENQGIMESFIEDGVLSVPPRVVIPRKTRLVVRAEDAEAIEAAKMEVEELLVRAEEINLADPMLDAPLNEVEYNAIMTELEKRGYEQNEETGEFEQKTEPKFRLQEGDKRVEDLKQSHNEATEKLEILETEVNAWRVQLEEEIAKQEAAAEVIEETPQNVKELARFTKRTPPVGEFTERGLTEVETSEFENSEEAQKEIHDYLKQKTELVQVRNSLRDLRRQISAAEKNKKTTRYDLRELGRKLKHRQTGLERNKYYIGLGIGRGKKAQMRMIWKRGKAIRNAQDAFLIGDAKAKELIANRRIHLMSEKEFNDFLVEFSNKADKIRRTLDARTIADSIIVERQYGKWENLLKSMGLPDLNKMSEAEAERFVAVLEKYQFGDTFITKRKLETIGRTDWGDIKTEREIFEKLQTITGATTQQVKEVKAPSFFKGYLTPWIRLVRKNPIYNWIINSIVKADVQATREFFEIETEAMKLSRAARKSRGGGAIQLLVPTDELLFKYIESHNKEEDKKLLTPEELKFADFIIAQNKNFYDYLKTLGTKELRDYLTHSRRSFLETIKDEGVHKGVKDLFASYEEEEAIAGLIDDTGKILAFDKFLGNMLHRTGKLVPSKDVTRVFLNYARAVTKKRALDELIPRVMMTIQAHRALTGFTPKGLEKEPSFEEFTKRLLNQAKGRNVDFGGFLTQGSTEDMLFRFSTAWVAVKYLGLNIASATGNILGDFMAVLPELQAKGVARGIYRSIRHPYLMHKANKNFRFFSGRNPFAEIFNPRLSAPSKVKAALMSLMNIASFQSNKFFLRALLTDEEFEKGMASDKRLAEIAMRLSRVKPNQFYVNSLAGNTSIGKASQQMGGWAVTMTNTTLSDAQEVIKILTRKEQGGWKEAFTSHEAWFLFYWTLEASLVGLAFTMLWSDDDDDYSFLGRMKRSLANNAQTLLQSLEWVADPTNYFLVAKEFIQITKMGKQLMLMEKYQEDGKGYGKGDPKWTETGKRIITPSALRQLLPEKEKVRTKEREVQEAIEGGEFDPEAIANLYYEDEFEEREGEDLEKYKAQKIAEIQALHALRERHPGEIATEVSNIIKYREKTTKKTVERLVEYEREVGSQVYDEVKILYKDKKLCAGMYGKPRKATDCLVSKDLLREYLRTRKKL